MSALPEGGREMRRRERYPLPAIALHWMIALLIIGMLLLGYYMVGIPKGTPDRAWYFNLHKSFGVLAGVLILARIGWRIGCRISVKHAAPPMPPGMPGWNVAAARWSHRLLYLGMLLQPATGYLSSSFNKYGIKFFGIGLPNWAWEDKPLRELFMGYHHIIAIAFAVLIGVHVLAAFKHLLIDRDGIFRRMLP